ncbi:hypothetical protein JL05_23365 [Serratia nematodiphila DZ0503SBS1]|nr:hypothetical protein JL05_23365 [Serratia nematodiphila DZ0503SBS1]
MGVTERRFVCPLLSTGVLHGIEFDVLMQRGAPPLKGSGAGAGMRKSDQPQAALAPWRQRFQAAWGVGEVGAMHGEIRIFRRPRKPELPWR